MRNQGEAVLRVEELRMRYGTNDVLHDVAFTAHRGEVLCRLGPNGAGKTTTIEILGAAAGLRRGGRDRPVLAAVGDPRRAGRVGRDRIGAGPDPAAPDGPAGVRVFGGGTTGKGAAACVSTADVLSPAEAE
jgi:hypothetical protein